jgi:hypothetical protein
MVDRTLAGKIGLKGGWALGENGWDVDMGVNLLKLSVLTQGSVLDSVAAEPGSPAQGDCYILKATHATHPNAVAAYDNGAWVYIAPWDGMILWNAAAAKFYTYSAAAGWAALATGSSSSGSSVSGLSLIARIVSDGTLTIADFANIPADFKHLRLIVCGRSAVAAATDDMSIRVNGDATAANYASQQLQGNNAAATALANPATNNHFGTLPGSTATANQAGLVDMLFPLYADTHFIKQWQGQVSLPGFPLVKDLTGRWNAATAINRITVVTNTGSAYAAGTTFELYGIQSASSAGTTIDRGRATLATAANTVSGAWTKAPLDTVAYDNNALWDATTKRFIPKKPGYYQVNARLRTNTSGAVTLAVGKNGAPDHAISNDATSDFAAAGSSLIYCNGTTDYLELFYFAGSVRALTTGAFDCHLEVFGPIAGVGSSAPWYYSPPLAADFPTFVSYSGVNVVLSDDADGGLDVFWGVDSLTAGDNSKGAYKALPAGVDWTLEVKFKYIGYPQNWTYAGIGFRNSGAAKKFAVFNIQSTAVATFSSIRQNGNTGQVAQPGPPLVGIGDDVFFKFVWSNAAQTLTIYVSRDGKRWMKWAVEAGATFLGTPDQVGFTMFTAYANAATDLGGRLTIERWKQSW